MLKDIFFNINISILHILANWDFQRILILEYPWVFPLILPQNSDEIMYFVNYNSCWFSHKQILLLFFRRMTFLFYYDVNVKYSNCFQFILQILVTTETAFCFRIPENLQRIKVFTCEKFWFECVYSFLVLYHAYAYHKNLGYEFQLFATFKPWSFIG